MTHYATGKKEYGLENKNKDIVLFKTINTNPLFNDFGIYMLDQLHTFQNMQSYAVDSSTIMEAFVKKKTTLHDGTVIYRFSKELLAYIETLVAFSQHHQADDPCTAGALDEFFTDALKAYATI